MKDKAKSFSTGYVFDPVFLQHTLSDHPENDKRLRAILDELGISRLIQGLREIDIHSATKDELSLVHRADYIDLVKEQCRQSRYLDPDTYTNPFTFRAAAHAAGGLIDLTSAVLDGTLRNGFAFLRPPGHHALSDRALCLSAIRYPSIFCSTPNGDSDARQCSRISTRIVPPDVRQPTLSPQIPFDNSISAFSRRHWS